MWLRERSWSLTAGEATTLSRIRVTGTDRTRRATLEGRPRFCRASIVSLGTSRHGFVAPITASATPIFKPTWTSSFFGSIAGEHRWHRWTEELLADLQLILVGEVSS